MAGALSTLVAMLKAAPSITANSVQVLFGEEEIADESYGVPSITVVPVGGPVGAPEYAKGTSPDQENQWGTRESIQLHLRAWSSATNATQLDHADAVESLRAWTLQALQYQRYQTDPTTNASIGGLWFQPVTGQWVRFGDAMSRYGRAYVLTVQADIVIPDATWTDATVTTLTETLSITPP